MRQLKLRYGKVLVMTSGTWIFTGQHSMDEVYADLGDASALIKPSLPAVEDLKIE